MLFHQPSFTASLLAVPFLISPSPFPPPVLIYSVIAALCHALYALGRRADSRVQLKLLVQESCMCNA